MIQERQELFFTSNLKAATALVTLGFERNDPFTVRTLRSDGQESTVFWFRPVNAEGLRAQDVFHGMTKGGDELMRKDPENVINYLRVFAANRDQMIAEIRNTPRLVTIELPDGRRVAIPETATKEQRQAILERMQRQ
jgi:hypothetical protein